MSQLHDMTVAYFQAAKDYFWQWAEEGEVIEWIKDGGTICYKTELLHDLSRINNHLPPPGPLLLVIAIGKPAPGPQAIQALLHQYVEDLFGDAIKGPHVIDVSREIEAEEMKVVITDFLALLRPLPGRYWKGADRELLLNTLFEHVETFLQGETAKEMLSICRRGAYDYVIAHGSSKDPLSTLKTDIGILQQILQRYPDTAALEEKLNAIVSPAPPVPALIEIPDDLPKPAQAENLLQILAEDNQTAPLALLTQRLIAALHLPMHTKGYSQTSFGGVSDITNKGNFDRLLLSELAHDNETLMVRLANNEALYLRREELPDNEPGQRFILVDKSIKLWGTPHLLEMAAALACTIDNKQHAEILPFALLGDRYEPMDLSSKAEIIASMQELSPALNSAKALSLFTETHILKGQQEYFLITGDELFHSVTFQQSFAALRRTDGFVITVNTDCQIQLYRYTAGHRKLLNTAKISMEMPKVRAKRTAVQRVHSAVDLPEFLKNHPLPLFIPYQLTNLNQSDSYFSKFAGSIAITKHRQLFFWPQKRKGARVITSNFPDAHGYFFGFDTEYLFILFQAKGAERLSLYQFKRSTLELTSIDVEHHESVGLIRRNGIMDVAFKPGTSSYGSFYVSFIGIGKVPNIVAVNTDSGEMTREPNVTIDMLKAMKDQYRENEQRHWQSFNTINSLKHLGINQKGNILVNKHELVFTGQDVQLVKAFNVGLHNSIHNTEQDVRLPDTRQTLSNYRWPDGSQAWFDPYRHMLHLRSSDKLVPEITLVLLVNQPTACWASDGATCGASYFRPDDQGNIEVLEPNVFHHVYIKPFIDIIQRHGTPAVI
ncbi:hypothetical protein [Chitinophaga ginsengisoli]|uniref:Uncharacterized protein n=1 Tax=Chitinophaga ginsengisoli TaxID=363837 RepID=A0A2P8FPK0_9BACT|nr:hypothetical protein [Chitinophaga ginsengisoli]PSL23661.1 hypothetical protein CLV42_11715 [Chitinophaga ginsengisoli]